MAAPGDPTAADTSLGGRAQSVDRAVRGAAFSGRPDPELPPLLPHAHRPRSTPRDRVISARTAGFGRVRSFDSHPWVQSPLRTHRVPQHLPSTADEPLLGGATPPRNFYSRDEQFMLSKLLQASVREADEELSEGEDESEELAAEAGLTERQLLLREGKRLLNMAIPLAVQNVFAQASSFISVGFAGHIGRQELSAAVLGTSIINVTGLALLAGLASAMETLCGQAYGAKNYKMVGVILQRALLICGTMLLAFLPLWFNMEPVFVAMGQDPVLAQKATLFIVLSIPSVMFIGAVECLKRYLMAQGVVTPAAAAAAVATLLSPLYNWLLIYKCGFGLAGAAYANDAVMGTQALLLWAYVLWFDRQLAGTPLQTWSGWSTACFQGWWAYLKIGIPSSAMVCMEWWSFEVLILLAGLLPDPDLSVSVVGICFNLASLIYMISFGLSGAASTRVSNALGGGRGPAARRSTYAAGVIVLAATFLVAAAVLALRNRIGLMFSDDPAVVNLVARVAPLLAISLIGDGVNGTFAGVIRGAGRQSVGAAVNLVAYWMLGVPFAIFLGFKAALGVMGFWIGMAATTVLQGGILAGVTLSFDWDAEAARARKLVDEQGVMPEDTAGLIVDGL